MKKAILRTGCFLAILIAVLVCWNHVFKFKFSDGIYSMTKFYEQKPDSIDVLILGSSHAYQDFNTGTLWDEYGIASYVLAASVQPMWNSYYYLKEALKTQTPRLIILEGFCTVSIQDENEDSTIIKSNFGLKWSGNKIDSIKVSVPEGRIKDFFPEYIQYHNRYKDLSYEDFLKDKGDPMYRDWKGFMPNMYIAAVENEKVGTVNERTPLEPEIEQYYREILKLAKDRNIPITVVISPFAGYSTRYQKVFNTAGDIAEEMEVPFFNCNLNVEETGLDYDYDAADRQHLNYSGNQKFSSYIGNYLVENFDIPDRRGDSAYDSWERNAMYLRQLLYDQEMKGIFDADQLFERISSADRWVFVTADGTAAASDEHIRRYLEKLGIPEDAGAGMWFVESGRVSWSSGGGCAEKYWSTPLHDIGLKRSAVSDGTYINDIIVDRISYTTVENGLNMIVYDPATDSVATYFGIDEDADYQVVR